MPKHTVASEAHNLVKFGVTYIHSLLNKMAAQVLC